MQSVLSLSQEFITETCGAARFDSGALQTYVRACGPDIARCMESAASIQVAHWMKVLEVWQAHLGNDWQRLRAATNTLFVARRGNVLYTVLAQYMDEEAIGNRLLLFETPEFTTTPDAMLELLARVEADRELGHTFFADAHLMDVDILASAARRAVQREAQSRNMTPILPPLASFDSHAWPWPTDPLSGSGLTTLDEALSRLTATAVSQSFERNSRWNAAPARGDAGQMQRGL
ncbi:hypothetical protein [Streptomyces sp. NPDC058701]|uniref:hypothetical protein n=1 Tax=Streptomyces sp. NPDC058701 TaxID=3346608 RepID=UPI003664867B